MVKLQNKKKRFSLNKRKVPRKSTKKRQRGGAGAYKTGRSMALKKEATGDYKDDLEKFKNHYSEILKKAKKEHNNQIWNSLLIYISTIDAEENDFIRTSYNFIEAILNNYTFSDDKTAMDFAISKNPPVAPARKNWLKHWSDHPSVYSRLRATALALLLQDNYATDMDMSMSAIRSGTGY